MAYTCDLSNVKPTAISFRWGGKIVRLTGDDLDRYWEVKKEVRRLTPQSWYVRNLNR